MPLSSPSEESRNPRVIYPGAQQFSAGYGINYFKFLIEPGFHYSCIINTNTRDHRLQSRGAPAVVNAGYTGSRFQGEMYGFALPDNGVPNNISPAKSNIMFFADPAYFSDTYYNYLHLTCYEDIPNFWIKLIKIPQKIFAHPFRGTIGYYNTFGHRTLLNGSLTPRGHDGIDVQPYRGEGQNLSVDMSRNIIPIADGTVTSVRNIGGVGRVVWIDHSQSGQTWTALYAHLNDVRVGVGDRVQKSITPIGTLRSPENHLHLEIFPRQTTQWFRGYTNGSGGQIDALRAIMEQ